MFMVFVLGNILLGIAWYVYTVPVVANTHEMVQFHDITKFGLN